MAFFKKNMQAFHSMTMRVVVRIHHIGTCSDRLTWNHGHADIKVREQKFTTSFSWWSAPGLLLLGTWNVRSAVDGAPKPGASSAT